MTSPLRPSDDPGWRGVFGGGGGRLSVLRLILCAVTFGVLALVAVVAVLEASDGADGSASIDAGAAVVGVIVVGVAALAIGEVIGRRQLDCSTDAALANSYSSRFFLRMAVAELPSLIGLAAYFMSRSVEPFAIGVLFSLVALQRSAPTVKRVAAETDRLQTGGCGRNLVLVLRSAAPAAGTTS